MPTYRLGGPITPVSWTIEISHEEAEYYNQFVDKMRERLREIMKKNGNRFPGIGVFLHDPEDIPLCQAYDKVGSYFINLRVQADAPAPTIWDFNNYLYQI